MAKGKPRPPVRITNQFRRGQAMAYDLSRDGIRPTVEVTPLEEDALASGPSRHARPSRPRSRTRRSPPAAEMEGRAANRGRNRWPPRFQMPSVTVSVDTIRTGFSSVRATRLSYTSLAAFDSLRLGELHDRAVVGV